MFTWICPQCGAEVPPAYSDCPNCKPPAPPPPRAAAPAPPPSAPVAPAGPTMVSRPTPTAPPRPTAPAPPPQPVYEYAPAQQQQPAAPPQPQYTYAPPPPRQALPAWLVTLLVFGGLVGAGYGFYNYVLNKPAVAASETAAPAAAEPTEGAAAAATPGARKRGSLEKNLEVAGIRILEQNKKPQLRMMLINHSSADMAELAGTVTLTADGKPVTSVPFSLASLGAYEAKEISAPIKTTLRAYEMPDWQFIKAQVSLKNVE